MGLWVDTFFISLGYTPMRGSFGSVVTLLDCLRSPETPTVPPLYIPTAERGVPVLCTLTNACLLMDHLVIAVLEGVRWGLIGIGLKEMQGSKTKEFIRQMPAHPKDSN